MDDTSEDDVSDMSDDKSDNDDDDDDNLVVRKDSNLNLFRNYSLLFFFSSVHEYRMKKKKKAWAPKKSRYVAMMTFQKKKIKTIYSIQIMWWFACMTRFVQILHFVYC